MTVAVSTKGASEPLRRHEKYDRLVAVAQSVPRLKVAVAHPCDAASLGAVFEAVELDLINPILVGPQAKITACAEALNKDLSNIRIVEAPHSHAAAEKAVVDYLIAKG
jgi:phosphate acetyltransferase